MRGGIYRGNYPINNHVPDAQRGHLRDRGLQWLGLKDTIKNQRRREGLKREEELFEISSAFPQNLRVGGERKSTTRSPGGGLDVLL